MRDDRTDEDTGVASRFLEDLEGEVARTLEALERRDELDSSRDVAPLAAAPDAVVIDSTAYTIDEVVQKIAQLIDGRRAR